MANTEEHVQISENLRLCKTALENLVEIIWKSQGLKKKVTTRLANVQNQLEMLRCELDNAWYRDTGDELNSPYDAMKSEPGKSIF